MRIHNFEQFVNEAYDDYGTPMWHKYTELQDELASLKQELKDLYSDMENDPEIEIEGGKVADEWGDKIEKKEAEIKKIDDKINKMENPGPRKAREKKSDAEAKLNKNIEDIKRSIKSWPERTIPQQAEIYKTRYKIDADVAEIANVLTALKAENKI